MSDLEPVEVAYATPELEQFLKNRYMWSQFVNNCKVWDGIFGKRYFPYKRISEAFVFYCTPEGHTYWAILEKEFLGVDKL